MVTSGHGHVQVERTSHRVVHASLCASNFVGATKLFSTFSFEGLRVAFVRRTMFPTGALTCAATTCCHAVIVNDHIGQCIVRLRYHLVNIAK